MKRCPNCGTTYTDETLKFCLADGASLNAFGEEPTVISGRGEPLRVDIPFASRTVEQASKPARKNPTAIIKTIIALFALVALATVVIGIAVAVMYLQSQENIFVNNATNISRTIPTPTATSDPEKDRLKNELANLQRQLDEKRSATAEDDSDLDDLDLEFRTATVDSPGDGFLAFRSEPSSEYGERLAQIPHGAKINVVSCDSDKVTIGSRRGSWCLVEWNSRAGWVFDAWLRY